MDGGIKVSVSSVMLVNVYMSLTYGTSRFVCITQNVINILLSGFKFDSTFCTIVCKHTIHSITYSDRQVFNEKRQTSSFFAKYLWHFHRG